MPPQHETPAAVADDRLAGVVENENEVETDTIQEGVVVARDDYDDAEGDDEDDDLPRVTSKEEIILPSPPIPEPRQDPLKFQRSWLQDLLKRHPNSATPNDLVDKALVVAPMVDQSDKPFRLLCRKYGANLAFTPMIHCRVYMRNVQYRKRFTPTSKGEAPLIAQLCGSDISKVLPTALSIQPYVDAIDINCGCPQGIAKRGKYGAYLMEEPERLIKVVRCLVRHLDIPVTVKVRLLLGTDKYGNDDNTKCNVQGSLQLYERLVDEGVSMLTIHGRSRLQKGQYTQEADWDAIRQAVELLGHRIPILANGSISNLQNVRDCLKLTGADGVMTSEAILEYPAFFSLEPGRNRTSSSSKSTSSVCGGIDDGVVVVGQQQEATPPPPPSPPGRVQLAFEYLQLAKKYPPDVGGQGSGLKCIRMHIHRMCHADLQRFTNFRDLVVRAKSTQQLEECLVLLQSLHEQVNHDIASERLSWYCRYRYNEDGSRCKHVLLEKDDAVQSTTTAGTKSTNDDDDDEEEEVFHDLFGTKDDWGGV